MLTDGSLFGRVLPGWVSDKVGRFNTHITMCYFSGIITLALWLPASGNAPLIVFAALYGIASGAWASLITPVIAQVSDLRELGIRTGLMFAAVSISALVSNPIGGAFISRDHGGFHSMKIWTGVVLLVGATMYLSARTSIVGFRVMAKV